MRRLNCAVFGHVSRVRYMDWGPEVHSHCAYCEALYRDWWADRLKLWWLIQRGIWAVRAEVREQRRAETDANSAPF